MVVTQTSMSNHSPIFTCIKNMENGKVDSLIRKVLFKLNVSLPQEEDIRNTMYMVSMMTNLCNRDMLA